MSTASRGAAENAAVARVPGIKARCTAEQQNKHRERGSGGGVGACADGERAREMVVEERKGGEGLLKGAQSDGMSHQSFPILPCPSIPSPVSPLPLTTTHPPTPRPCPPRSSSSSLSAPRPPPAHFDARP